MADKVNYKYIWSPLMLKVDYKASLKQCNLSSYIVYLTLKKFIGRGIDLLFIFNLINNMPDGYE